MIGYFKPYDDDRLFSAPDLYLDPWCPGDWKELLVSGFGLTGEDEEDVLAVLGVLVLDGECCIKEVWMF